MNNLTAPTNQIISNYRVQPKEKDGSSDRWQRVGYRRGLTERDHRCKRRTIIRCLEAMEMNDSDDAIDVHMADRFLLLRMRRLQVLHAMESRAFQCSPAPINNASHVEETILSYWTTCCREQQNRP